MVNPYNCYIFGFAISLLVYLLGWSEYYPTLSKSLLFFLLATIAVHFVCSRIWMSKNQIQLKNYFEKGINPWLVTGFLYLLWIIDFIHDGGIPLVKIVLNVPFDYKKFGFPSLHVLAVTFGSFYSIYLFHLFLIKRKKTILLLYAINLLPAILIYSRAMLFFNLASSGFLFLLQLETIPYKKMLLLIPVIITLLYLFGVAGTKRVSFESKSEYDHKFFLESAGATEQFRNSNIPKEFYWSYFYISSPIANLQLNINSYKVKPITARRIFEYVNNELLFESFSKRINQWLGIEREKENGIKEQFNVSTVYSRSYSYLGWLGMFIMSLVIAALPFVYDKLLANSPFRLVGLAILCTSFFFMSYDNTIRLMGLGFQLVYPVVFPWIERRLAIIKK